MATRMGAVVDSEASGMEELRTCLRTTAPLLASDVPMLMSVVASG